MEETKYRHELKYEINYGEYLILRERLKTCMELDSHTDFNGKYLICSLYFDSLNDKALKEKLDGVNERIKYRIRYYENNLNYMKLEKKKKQNNLCLKNATVITEEECKKILLGDYVWMADCERKLICELYQGIIVQQLRPKTIVQYIREPYIFKAGNVRITFDMNLCTGIKSLDFLNKDHNLFPVLSNGKLLMEVKYDEFLPDIMHSILQIGDLRQQAYSKYSACRSYEF